MKKWLRFSGFRKIVVFSVLFTFSLFNIVTPSFAQSINSLPKPGTMIQLSAPYSMATLRGVKVDVHNPLIFDFILDKGDTNLKGQALSHEGRKLIKYFLTALTVPQNDLWVNLSPYEKDRITTNAFGKTEMGRDMLEEDYILKQLTASLMYPESRLGKEF
ncbi:MAG: hypothetical protein KGI24_08945, partial [Candidatus Omnitrophica bacterium]|nr:hypothetical protein [Candidatus Omnitrophota bacterium]